MEPLALLSCSLFLLPPACRGRPLVLTLRQGLTLTIESQAAAKLTICSSIWDLGVGQVQNLKQKLQVLSGTYKSLVLVRESPRCKRWVTTTGTKTTGRPVPHLFICTSPCNDLASEFKLCNPVTHWTGTVQKRVVRVKPSPALHFMWCSFSWVLTH